RVGFTGRDRTGDRVPSNEPYLRPSRPLGGEGDQRAGGRVLRARSPRRAPPSLASAGLLSFPLEKRAEPGVRRNHRTDARGRVGDPEGTHDPPVPGEFVDLVLEELVVVRSD